jgi:hypothetical protein
MRNHSRVVVVQSEGGCGLLGAGDEELHRLIPHQAAGIDWFGRIGHSERRHSPSDLAGQMKRFPTGGQNSDARTVLNDCAYQPGSGVDHVLAIVQDDNELSCRELSSEGGHGRTRAGECQLQGRGDRRRNQVGVPDA